MFDIGEYVEYEGENDGYSSRYYNNKEYGTIVNMNSSTVYILLLYK